MTEIIKILEKSELSSITTALKNVYEILKDYDIPLGNYITALDGAIYDSMQDVDYDWSWNRCFDESELLISVIMQVNNLRYYDIIYMLQKHTNKSETEIEEFINEYCNTHEIDLVDFRGL